MKPPSRSRTPIAVAAARRLTRLLTWGMEPQQRERALCETDDDWGAMYNDFGSARVLGRALRGIPAAILARMNDQDLTAVPASLGLTVMATAGAGAALLGRTYPADVRRWVLIGTIGLALSALALIRTPRRVVLHSLRWPTLAIAAGSLGVALNMPGQSDWMYDYPYVDTRISDWLTVAGFVLVAIGCLVVAAASYLPRRRLTAGIGAAGVCAGILVFGLGQVLWGLIAAPIDLAVTATALGIGLGAWALAHVLPRLRHLEII